MRARLRIALELHDFALPAGGLLHEILVGCISGFYNYGPSPTSLKRAGCTGTADAMHCTMPRGGGGFDLARGRKHRLFQHARATFMVVTVTGTDVTATPMTLDDAGHPIAFYR